MKTTTKTKGGNKKPGLKTTKKQKFVGVTEMLDTTTGELVPMQLVEVEDRDFNFHKVWLQNLILSLDGISNQRLKLAFWILEHLNKENQLIMTQRAIAEKSGMSLTTVMRTMTILQEGNPAFLQKINSGAYMVNPDVVWKGSYYNRMGVCLTYRENAEPQQEDAPATAQQGPQSGPGGPGGPQDTQDTQEPPDGPEEPLEGQESMFEDFQDEIPDIA